MTSRDWLQVISGAVSLMTLIVIMRKLVHKHGDWRMWLGGDS